VFNITKIVNEAGNDDYPYFWTSTSNPYIDPKDEDGYWYAWYVAFGYAVGTDGQDLHGSGAVRFDTKHVYGADGPDGERYYNYVRLVRGGDVIETPEGDPSTVKADRVVSFPDGDTGGIVSGERGPASADSKDAKQGHPDGPTSENMQGAPGPNSQQPGPDFDAIAKKLGISVDALMTAFGDPIPGCQPDFAAIAKKLGITLDQLIEAMGTMDGPPGPNMN